MAGGGASPRGTRPSVALPSVPFRAWEMRMSYIAAACPIPSRPVPFRLLEPGSSPRACKEHVAGPVCTDFLVALNYTWDKLNQPRITRRRIWPNLFDVELDSFVSVIDNHSSLLDEAVAYIYIITDIPMEAAIAGYLIECHCFIVKFESEVSFVF